MDNEVQADVVNEKSFDGVETPVVEASVVKESAVESKTGDGVSSDGIKEDAPYVPNYKFTAANKEYEIDEFIRPVIKDPETEQKIKTLYSKAYGLDLVKRHRDELKESYQTLKQEYDAIYGDVQKAAHFIKNEDIFGLMEFLGIPKESVFKAVKSELDYLQMTPEQRSIVDAQKQAQLRAYELEQSNLTLQQQMEQQQIDALDYQFRLTMASPDVQKVASYYESLPGKKPGDFSEAVLRHGSALEKLYGKILPPIEVIKDFINYIGYSPELNNKSSVQEGPAAAQNQEHKVVIKPEKPTITSVKAKPSSPVKSKVRSIEDLKKLREQMSHHG